MTDPIYPMTLDEPFRFACHPDVPCFTDCCCDLNQTLTPYDILRLSRRLNLSTRHFLDTYAAIHTGPESGLPVAVLIPQSDGSRRCPFVDAAGCRVYDDRPASCRIYPLARAIARDRATGAITEHVAVIREPHCRGFSDAAPAITPRQWIADQSLAPYNRHNDQLMSLIYLKNRLRPGPLSPEEIQRVVDTLYDLDGFRDRRRDDDAVQRMDDDALLIHALGEVRQRLFGSHGESNSILNR